MQEEAGGNSERELKATNKEHVRENSIFSCWRITHVKNKKTNKTVNVQQKILCQYFYVFK